MKYEIGTMTAEEARAELRELIDMLEKTERLIDTDPFTAEALGYRLKDQVVFYHGVSGANPHLRRIRRGSKCRLWRGPLAEAGVDLKTAIRELDKEAFKG